MASKNKCKSEIRYFVRAVEVNDADETDTKPSSAFLKALLIEYRAYSNHQTPKMKIDLHRAVETKNEFGGYQTETLDRYLWYQLKDYAVAFTDVHEYEKLKSEEGVQLMQPMDKDCISQDGSVWVLQRPSKIKRRFAISKKTYHKFLIAQRNRFKTAK
jgi:hypothetical protein